MQGGVVRIDRRARLGGEIVGRPVVILQDGDVRYVSPAAAAILGRRAADVVAELAAAQRDGDEVFEVDVMRPDGERRIAEISLGEGRWEGAPARLALVRDVTVERRAGETSEDLEVAAALARAGAELNTRLDSSLILSRLCALGNDLLASRLCVAFLWDAEADAFVPRAAAGEPELDDERRRAMRLPRWRLAPLLRAFEAGDTAMVQAGRGTHPALERLGLGLSCPVLLVAAIRDRDHLVGFLAVGSGAQGGWATGVRRRISQGLARIAAGALEKARQLEEAERRQRLRAEFVATMSHELRAPLHVITGFQSLLLEGDFGPVTDEQADALRRIGKSAQALLELIDNTLNQNRIAAGRLPVDLGDVAAASLIAEVERETSDLRDCSPLRFAWQIEPDLPAIRTDAPKLKIVLKNLLGNAIKYTDTGSVTVAARRRDGGVEISVADTGIGIDATSLGTIFEAFRQVRGGGGPERGGVGLGLHIVRRMLDMIGGEIRVESEPGQGSVFRVWVPQGQSAVLREAGADRAPEDQHDEKTPVGHAARGSHPHPVRRGRQRAR